MEEGGAIEQPSLTAEMPGGYRRYDRVFYTGPSHAVGSFRLDYSMPGTVLGPARDDSIGGLAVRFDGSGNANSNWANVHLDELSREPPPPVPGGYKLHEHVYHVGPSTRCDDGAFLEHGHGGVIVGPAVLDGCVCTAGVELCWDGNPHSLVSLPLDCIARKPPLGVQPTSFAVQQQTTQPAQPAKPAKSTKPATPHSAVQSSVPAPPRQPPAAAPHAAAGALAAPPRHGSPAKERALREGLRQPLRVSADGRRAMDVPGRQPLTPQSIPTPSEAPKQPSTPQETPKAQRRRGSSSEAPRQQQQQNALQQRQHALQQRQYALKQQQYTMRQQQSTLGQQGPPFAPAPPSAPPPVSSPQAAAAQAGCAGAMADDGVDTLNFAQRQLHARLTAKGVQPPIAASLVAGASSPSQWFKRPGKRADDGWADLTARERLVARLAAKGLTPITHDPEQKLPSSSVLSTPARPGTAAGPSWPRARTPSPPRASPVLYARQF